MKNIDYIAAALKWYEEDTKNRSISLDTHPSRIQSLCLPDSHLSIWLYDYTLSGGMYYVGGEINDLMRNKVREDKSELLTKLQAELAP